MDDEHSRTKSCSLSDNPLTRTRSLEQHSLPFLPGCSCFSRHFCCVVISPGSFGLHFSAATSSDSPEYVLAHIKGHLFLLFIFPVPLAVYLVLLRLGQRISKATFLALLVLVLSFEFLSSTELFATTTVFASLALALSYLIYEEQFSVSILQGCVEIACAYVVTTLLLAPYLYWVLARGVPAPFNPSSVYSNDLSAFAIPTHVLRGRISGLVPGVIRWLLLALSEITKTCGLWFSAVDQKPLIFSSPSRQSWPMAQSRAGASYLSSSPLKD